MGLSDFYRKDEDSRWLARLFFATIGPVVEVVAQALLSLRSLGAEEGEDLSCRHLPRWRLVQALAVELESLSEPSVANRSLFQVALQNAEPTLNWLLDGLESRQEIAACPLGARVLRLLHILSAPKYSERTVTADMDFLDESSPPLLDMIDSGWPLFGLAQEILRAPAEGAGVDTQSLAVTPDIECKLLRVDAIAKHREEPLLLPDHFSMFLQQHFLVRPKRMHVSASSTFRFWEFASSVQKGRCDIARAVAEFSVAFVLLHPASRGDARKFNVNKTPPSTFIDRADRRLRRWWAYWKHYQHIQATDLLQWERTNLQRRMQVQSLQLYPMYTLLQSLQNILYLDSRGGSSSLGLGMDRIGMSIADFLQGSPAFWEQRRRALCEAVFGSIAWRLGLPEPSYHFLKVTEQPKVGAAERQQVLTWQFKRLTSTAVLTRPPGFFSGLPSGRVQGLIIHHTGHEADAHNLTEGRTDPTGFAEWASHLGFDVLTLCMPLVGFNKGDLLNLRSDEEIAFGDSPARHSIFAHWEAAGEEALLGYFIGPVLLALDWAAEKLGHKHFAIVGYSGGGWTANIAAALDTRISLSVAVPAPLPPHLVDMLEWRSYDWEAQMNPRSVYDACSILCMHVLSAVGGHSGRRAAHIFHDWEAGPVHEDVPAAGSVRGLEKELHEYYDRVIPSILESVAPRTAGVEVLVSGAKSHLGDERDIHLISMLLARWADELEQKVKD